MPNEPDSTPTATTLTLTAGTGTGRAVLQLDLAAGGRARRLLVGDPGVDVLADAGPHPDPRSTGWGSFPMAPWAGRIRHGRFTTPGDEIHLDLNHRDDGGEQGPDEMGAGGGPIDPPIHPAVETSSDSARREHAIHGTTFQRPWTVDSADASTCSMHCGLTGELAWPFDGVARQRVEVTAGRVDLTLSVEAADTIFPASIGWHPWFTKPDRLGFEPLAMYERDEIGLPTGRLITPSDGPWDDCFINTGPVVLFYDRPGTPRITVRSDCDHWVVFDQPDHATCVEPQSGPPDAPTIRPQLVAPGAPLTRTMSIEW